MSLAMFKKGLMSETKAVAVTVISAVVGAIWFFAARETMSLLTVGAATVAVLYAIPHSGWPIA